ncbi:hypothetical protein [Gynuella sp.]|uniref:hypothetical protein n=1 Tax=Gynuella sp. TaxID=2969146 RepID=UPI003D0EEA01
MLTVVPIQSFFAQDKTSTHSVESEELYAWFIDRLCTSIKRGHKTKSTKGFRNEEYFARYCGDSKPPHPPRLIPKIIVAEFPGDSEYPVGPGLSACDVIAGEENTCDTFATNCLEGLKGTGWCEENENGDGTCWCEYDPDVN